MPLFNRGLAKMQVEWDAEKAAVEQAEADSRITVDPLADFTETERLLHALTGTGIGSGDAFWQLGGDNLLDRLTAEGWRITRIEADYYWVVSLKDRFISYTEGDVNFSDNPSCGRL